MKKIGIWLDKEKAHLVTLQNEDVRFNTIYSQFRQVLNIDFKYGTTPTNHSLP